MRGSSRSTILAVAAAAALAVAACAAALRHPTPRDVPAAATGWPGTTLADLQRGRTLYVRRCSSCHTLPLPSAYGAEQWPALVQAMSDRARLTPEQQKDVTRFVVTLSRRPAR